ncbi:hypothetical protein B0O80DRAFT_440725 [Mortierella sp. GBAus27b]|nr:hypothetical protein B0O80DRAFT_440725 [Mortierella sp. GBAus27b]
MKGLGAASDPRTGKVYVPGGDRTSMWAYDPMTGLTYSESKQPYLQDLAYYSVAWASALKSVLVFGGNTGAGISPKNDLYAYSPENGWTVLQPLGTIPPERVVTCLVPAYGGTKMVLFGGFGKDPVRADTLGPGLNDLYILDVNSMTWTRGSDAPSAEARGGHSCAVSGDYLIVWGGASNTLSRVSDVVVYNMKTSSWTSSYVALPNHAPPPYVGVPTSGNGSSQDSSSNGFSTIAIAGTAVGVLAVVIVIGWVLYIYFQGTSSKAPIISDENDSSTPMKPLAQATQTTQPPQPQYEVVVEVSAPPPCYIPHAELRQSLPPRPPPCYIPHPQPARCSIPSRPPQPIRPTQLFKTQQHIFNSWQQQQQTFVAPQDQGFFNSQMDLTGQFQDPLGGSFGDFGGSFDDFGGSFGDLGDAFGILGSFDLGSF